MDKWIVGKWEAGQGGYGRKRSKGKTGTMGRRTE